MTIFPTFSLNVKLSSNENDHFPDIHENLVQELKKVVNKIQNEVYLYRKACLFKYPIPAYRT